METKANVLSGAFVRIFITQYSWRKYMEETLMFVVLGMVPRTRGIETNTWKYKHL